MPLFRWLDEDLLLNWRISAHSGPRHIGIELAVGAIYYAGVIVYFFGWILVAAGIQDVEYSSTAWVAVLTFSIFALSYILRRQLSKKFGVDPV